MSDTPKDPRMDWGFYAMTPRIVRTKYKDLSHTEKWLYTCLKDLCGKKGTCFRSLRSLKEETDISIASLSTMIPKLHAAGLIHAEKKRRSASGKEIWHISIVDIWQLNKDYCSEIEQSSSEDVQNLNNDPEIVQSVNNDVQNLNKTSGDCSEIERDCSNFSDRRRDSKNKDTKIYNEEENTGNVAHRELPTPAPSLENTPYRPELTGQSRDATYEEAWEAYKRIEPRYSRTNQMLANGEMPTLKAVDTPQGDANGYHATPSVAAELSTSQGSSPQSSAKVEPKPPQPSSKVVANGKSNIPATAQVKPQLTLLGGQVREWYDIIRATRTRLTAKNVEAFNVLSELDGMSFESLKEVMDSIEDDPWVKARPTFTFDVQDLASEDGKWRFDRWYQVVQRNRQRQACKPASGAQPPPTSSSLPSYATMSDDDYYAMLSQKGGNGHARTAHAR